VILSYNGSQQDALFLNFTLIYNFDSVFTTTVICRTSYVDCLLADSQHK